MINDEVINGQLKKLPWFGCDFPIYSQIFVHKDKHINTAMQGLLNIRQAFKLKDIRNKQHYTNNDKH